MICQTSSRFGSENTPPIALASGKSAKACNCRHTVSRRRRDRALGGIHHPRYAIENASLPTATTSISLPRRLARPQFRDVSADTLKLAAPELANAHPDYIRDKLANFGPEMLRVLSGVEAQPVTNKLPRELSVIINDISSDLPTHLLAVYSRQHGPHRRLTLFPTHNIMLAAHCTNLPALPTQKATSIPDVAGSSITLPIIPLCIPSPETFPHLSRFIYTKRVDELYSSLLPRSTSTADPSNEGHSAALAAMCTSQTLLTHVMTVHGLWMNVCALGIFDEGLWHTMDVAWEVLLGALAITTGKPVA
ncbi:hypothetical protein BJ138DRAFT_1171679 [Hygrophoropsis aurantiaca]|uniref:Uncharacterized protein n=1 Tax=Hygrophoropsis aurantiaca TaxID=72124 RepID=A0ACB8AHI4_9AGAM|nr:hypothetical protein BJ138DRAFT_1171679 [Hygrophoropsis aurantiaca]